MTFSDIFMRQMRPEPKIHEMRVGGQNVQLRFKRIKNINLKIEYQS
jgi:hypothetical protein